MLPNLSVLRLGTCGITSSVTSLLHSNLTSLEILDLSGNNLDGQVAKNWFWKVTSLKSLNLMFCVLSGQLPDELGNLTKLEGLYMTDNYIRGIPSTMDKLCSLKVVDFNWNNINGDITDFMERIPRCARNKLMEFNLAHNMTGNLPSWVGNLTCLTRLTLSFNQVTGSVPAGIGALTNLTSLGLDNNNLIGVISEDHFAGLSSLELIDLSYNHLKIVIDSNWIPRFRLGFATLILLLVRWAQAFQHGLNGKRMLFLLIFQGLALLVSSQVGFGLYFPMPANWILLEIYSRNNHRNNYISLCL